MKRIIILALASHSLHYSGDKDANGEMAWAYIKRDQTFI